MAGGGQEKTEKPTEKKLRDARKEGNVAKSQELRTAVLCLGGALALSLSGGLVFEHTRALLQELWGHGFQYASETHLDRALFLRLSLAFLIMVGPSLAVIVLLAVGINLVQVRGIVAWEAIQPKFSKLNPLKGLQQMFSTQALVELIKSLFKVAIVSGIVTAVLQAERDRLVSLIDMEVIEIAGLTADLSIRILMRAGLVMLLLSIADYSYQRWKFRKDLMMTKEEVKEEHKQTEGNPLIKSRIRSLQRSLARRRMMSRVPQADVIVTNPTHYAIALSYTQEMEAPRLVAKGKDLIARKIIAIARKHGIPVVQDPPLARALYQQVDLEGTIPIALYRAVAKVLAFVYQQRHRKSG